MICSKLCEDGSFFLYSSCFKCDNILFGNPGCLSSSKCIIKNNQLNCGECKEGYFQSSQGCSPCSKLNIGCKICTNSSTNNFKCDECFDGYNLNSSNLCELMKYGEYPEISPGCLISKDNLTDYKSKSKCQSCKEGYFKTNDETCIYCKSNLYGGHGCEQCDYFDDNQIKCKYCPKGSILDNDRKCLKCEEELGEGCSNCMYILNEEDKSNKLICTECITDYYLNSNGHCIYPKNYAKYIPNCDIVNTQIKPKINFDLDNININLYSGYEIIQDNYEINSFCSSCKQGYYNKNGECIELNIDNCIFSSLFNDYNKTRMCHYNLCSNEKKYAMIYYHIDIPTKIITANSNYKLIDYLSFEREEVFKSLKANAYMCIGNLGTGGKDNPVNLKYCREALYNKINNDYECTKCLSGYTLDKETKLCIQEIKYMNEYSGLNCDFENIGTTNEPLYSCINCNNQNDILVTAENGAKFCINASEIEGCTEANVNTAYINNIYNCTKCNREYILYKSKFYERNICQNISLPIKRNNNSNVNEYSKIEKDSVKAENGECENNKLFTPDNENCYACNDKNVGMPGCKGACTFSKKRENPLECEDNGCKIGYIEITKGICDTCNNANKGCVECHYENNYPINYKGLKRKRRFVCDQCEEGYILSANGTCHTCKDFGLDKCETCEWDLNRDNELTCSQCYPGYFTSESGKCIQCNDKKVRVKENKCASCNDREYGGMEGCILCKSDNITIIGCEKCDKGYILYDKNKTCLKISDNAEFQKFPNCQILTFNNNKLECSLCNNNYIKFSENNEDKCISSDFILSYNIIFNKYCQKFINKGTIEKPNFSCDKCIDDNFLDNEYKSLTKFTFKTNGTSFCNLYNEYYDIGMYKEATIIENKESIEYNCTKCYEGNYLYNRNSNLFYCKNNLDLAHECRIENCKACKKNNNNFCEICYKPYESNSITGSCFKTTEKIPSIIWKAIYGLKMNQTKMINGKIYYGPSLILRGITSSQINKGHTFSFYLSFGSKKLIRNLQNIEMIKKVPMICQTSDQVDENENDVNIVEYNCFGNITKDESEELTSKNSDTFQIEEDNLKNIGKLMPSNLNDMDLYNIKEENQISQFSLEQFLKTSIFELNEINNQTSNTYQFNFKLNGKIKGNFNSNGINEKLDIYFNVIGKKDKCNLIIDEHNKASLNCDINLEEHSNYSVFSFKVSNYDAGDKIIDLSQVNNIYLKKEEKKEKEEKDENKDNKKKLMRYIIYGAVGFAIIVTIITIILCVRKKKIHPMIRNLNVKQYNPKAYQPTLVTNKIHKQIKIKNKPSKNQKKKFKKSFKSSKKSQEINENDSSRKKILIKNKLKKNKK